MSEVFISGIFIVKEYIICSSQSSYPVIKEGNNSSNSSPSASKCIHQVGMFTTGSRYACTEFRICQSTWDK